MTDYKTDMDPTYTGPEMVAKDEAGAASERTREEYMMAFEDLTRHHDIHHRIDEIMNEGHVVAHALEIDLILKELGYNSPSTPKERERLTQIRLKVCGACRALSAGADEEKNA